MLEEVKSGKKIVLDLSFLNKEQNKLLTDYINSKIKKRYYNEKLEDNMNELRDLRKQAKMKETPSLVNQIDDLERSIPILEDKNIKYKFSHFPSKERQRIHRINNKIKKKIDEYVEKGEEYEAMKRILEYLEI